MVIVPTTETRTTYMQHSFLHTVIPNLPSSAATSVSLPMFKYLVSQLYFTIVSRVHLVLALVLFVYPCNSAELSLKKGARKCELNHKALQPTVGLLLHHPMAESGLIQLLSTDWYCNAWHRKRQSDQTLSASSQLTWAC